MSDELEGLDKSDLEDIMRMLDQIDLDQDDDVNYNSIMGTFGLDLKELEDSMEGFIPKMEVTFSKSHSDAVTPKYAYPSDSGFDLYSTEEVTISGGDRKLIPTGIHIDIPEGYEIQVRSKSGLALKQGLMVLNSPGTVDQGYTGEIQIIMFNTTKNKVQIEKGQKVAQAVLCPVVSGKWINIIEKNELNIKDRNENGFGSTGLV
jgi:dUTP pyrophosphatase